jgi:hypothetical protein
MMIDGRKSSRDPSPLLQGGIHASVRFVGVSPAVTLNGTPVAWLENWLRLSARERAWVDEVRRL